MKLCFIAAGVILRAWLFAALNSRRENLFVRLQHLKTTLLEKL